MLAGNNQIGTAIQRANAAISVARDLIEARESISSDQTRGAILTLMAIIPPLVEHAQGLDARIGKLEVLLEETVDALMGLVACLKKIHSRLP